MHFPNAAMLPTLATTLAAVIAGSAGPAPTSFDLVCTGQVENAGGSSPLAMRLSVDLASKRWCDRSVGCPYKFPIISQMANKLQLLAVKTAYNEAAFELDLKSGAFTRTTRIPDRPDSGTSAKGICTMSDYTPMT